MQTVDNKTAISGLRWQASDQYGLLITVGGVGGVGVTTVKPEYFHADVEAKSSRASTAVHFVVNCE